MGLARHPLSFLALALAVVALGAGGCGSSDEGDEGTAGGEGTAAAAPAGAAARSCSATIADVADLSVTGVSCEAGDGLATAWATRSDCREGGSRMSCSVAAYRCLGARTDRGIAVSCARPGRSISFVAGRG